MVEVPSDGALRMVEVPLLEGRDGEPVQPSSRLGLHPVGQRRESGSGGVTVRLVGGPGAAFQGVGMEVTPARPTPRSR